MRLWIRTFSDFHSLFSYQIQLLLLFDVAIDTTLRAVPCAQCKRVRGVYYDNKFSISLDLQPSRVALESTAWEPAALLMVTHEEFVMNPIKISLPHGPPGNFLGIFYL